MNKRTCTMPECERSHRARGLCATHYNQTHVKERHKKKLVACVWCGIEVLKGGGGGRRYGAVCSSECRTALSARSTLGVTRSNLPPEHWAFWFGRTSAWPRYSEASCDKCQQRFITKATNQRFCTLACSARWHHDERVRKSGGTQASAILSTARSCSWCGQTYNHASKQRIHCSDQCRDEAKDQRGATLHHGWIYKSKRLAIYERDNHTCWLCGDAVDYEGDPKAGDWAPSLDHVTPRSKGGTHDPANLRTAHRWCNSVRSDNEMHDLFAEVAYGVPGSTSAPSDPHRR